MRLKIKKMLCPAIAIGLVTQMAMAVPVKEMQPKELQISTTVNELSGKFLRSKLRLEGLGNAMVSSVSLYYALSILEGGAAGDSAELLNSLLVTLPELEVSDIAPALEDALVSTDTGRPGMGSFSLTNSVWSTNGATNNQPFVFSGQFRADSQNYYGASVHSIDFMSPGAAQVVNNWANDATEGLIPEVIDKATLQGLEWVIMNAAYFEGSWGTQMHRIQKNEQYWFTTLDGIQRQADTIGTRNYKGRVLDREGGGVAFGLPFVGGKYSLVIYLPSEDENDLKHWLLKEAVIDMPEVVTQVLENRSEIYNLFVQLPIFSFSDEVKMLAGSEMASDLGLSYLFSDKANFNRMIDSEKSVPADKETKVGIIKQDTKIELDEKGVKAAAVSLIGGMIKTTSISSPVPRREIIVDKPFMFAIVENRSQTILFNGVLVSPE